MGGALGDLTDVGSYTGAASPSGTFDQGGNLWEWNETIGGGGIFRGKRGGSFGPNLFGDDLAAARQVFSDPATKSAGFRVARFEALAAPSLSPFGVATLGSLLGLAGLRKLRASS